MEPLNIVIWTDCRGLGISHFLKEKTPCNIYKYEVHELGRFNESPPGYSYEK